MSISTLHLCTSDAWGGLELYACTLMNELQSSGCTVVAVCKPRSKIEEFLRQKGIPCEHLPYYGHLSLRSAKYLQSLIHLHKAEAVHVHFHSDIWPASLALRHDITRTLLLSLYMGVGPKNDWFHKYIYKRVDGFVTSSPSQSVKLPELYPVPSTKVHYLPYGRKLEDYTIDQEKRQSIRASLNVRPDEMLVGTMVRLDPAKGAMDLVESYLYLNERIQQKVKFLVVGEPSRKGNRKTGESPFEPRCEEYGARISAFIQEHKLEERILLTGFKSDLIGYLSSMDIFVFPSRGELYSLVMLDAMALSLPILAARAGGNLEQISDGINGLFYNAADSRDLAQKLSLLCDNTSLRQHCGHLARSFVEQNHDMNKTLAQLIKFYKSKTSIRN